MTQPNVPILASGTHLLAHKWQLVIMLTDEHGGYNICTHTLIIGAANRHGCRDLEAPLYADRCGVQPPDYLDNRKLKGARSNG